MKLYIIMKKREMTLILLLILSVILFLSGWFFDEKISQSLPQYRIEIITNLMILVSSYYFLFAVFTSLIICLYLKDNVKSKKIILKLLISLVMTSLIGNILKLIIQRPRPIENIFLLKDFSFPSLHTANSFAIALLLSYRFPKLKLFLFFSASLVAFSRIYLGVHYLTDIAAGILLGSLIGLLMQKTIKD